jgi:hypothetical protein
MSHEETQTFDDADRKKGVAMHQNGFVDMDLDRIWRKCTQEEMIDLLPCRVDVQNCDQPVSEEELRLWSDWGMLPPGRGGRPTTQRRKKEMHMFNVSQDIAAFEHKMLQQVANWEPDFAWVPRPLSCGTRYFLVLFSGHRRFADMAQWFSWTSDIVPICIDLAVDPVHGNVLKDALWVRLIRARKVTGAHAGPPCETYSFARWLEIIGGGGRGRCVTQVPMGERPSHPQGRRAGLYWHHSHASSDLFAHAGIFAWWQLHFGASEGTRMS